MKKCLHFENGERERRTPPIRKTCLSSQRKLCSTKIWPASSSLHRSPSRFRFVSFKRRFLFARFGLCFKMIDQCCSFRDIRWEDRGKEDDDEEEEKNIFKKRERRRQAASVVMFCCLVMLFGFLISERLNERAIRERERHEAYSLLDLNHELVRFDEDSDDDDDDPNPNRTSRELDSDSGSN